ncbi:MAG: host specificity protein, partial [Pseudomonadota bacterium]
MTELQGAKGASTPTEASDTLRSTQRAEIIDLLGEGQIGGLVNGLKSVYLDGVPVENADGSRNFGEFGYQLALGGPTTENTHAFGDVQTEVGVGVTVLAAVPVVRTITDVTADQVRVTILVPQLVQQQDNGDRVGTSVEYKIEVQSNGGGYQPRWTETITGKATSPYSRAVLVKLADLGPAPYDVRVTRITADSASANLVNAMAWASYTVISGVRMRYRNSAVARITFDAKNFSAIPSRWYDMMGLSDWDIPVNYDPLARTVTGSWNGLWKQGWTNNPAWVLHNLIKHPRYGLGQYVVQLPDKWTLYQLAAWCDEPLSNGRGGTEPRYTINAWIVEQTEALRLLSEICAVFRGVLMHGGSTLTVTWDAPGEPVASYTPANVVDGLFTYADGSSAAKKTSCTCWYTDRSQAGKRVPATWDDADLVARYGLRTMEINPIGVASPAQALRMAKWALYTAHFEEQTVAFRVGSEGPVRRLGEVFQISDPSETGERLGGRIHAATSTTVDLDASVLLLGGETYTLWVTQPDPADHTRLVLESRTVTTAAGTVETLTVTPAFSAVPVAQTVWLLEGSTVAPTLWRYVNISEAKGDDGRTEYDVLGVRYEPGKWAQIEQDQPLTVRPTRRLANVAPPVASITITETLFYDQQGGAHIRVTVSWPIPAPGLRYVLAWRMNDGAWTTLPPSSANSIDAVDLQPGVYEVQVQTLNGLGHMSLPVTQTAVLVGEVGRPDDVTGLAFQIVPGGLRLEWQPNSRPGHGMTRLSYGASYATSTFFWEGNATDTVVRPPADGVYLVWAVHISRAGVLSLVPSSLEVPYVASAAGSDGLNNATVVLYQRAASAPAVPSGAVVYTFSTGGVSGLSDGWLADIPAGTLPLWVVKAVASSTTATDSIGSGEWQTPVVLAQDGEAGATAPSLVLVADPMIFTTPANSDTPTPATTTISAITTNLPGATYAWTVDGVPVGATGGAVVATAFPSGSRRTVTCTATSGALSASDTISIYSLREGSDAFAAGLDNEAQNVTCDNAGTPSPAGQLPLTAQVYCTLGAAFVTAGVTYGIQAGTNSGFSGPSISSTGAVSIAGITADAASVVFTATRGSVTIPMRFTATKTRAGAPGSAGQAGASTRIAYALYTGNPTMSGAAVTTTGPSSLPATTAWAPTAATAFSTGVQIPASGQALLMTMGTYDPGTNLTTWQQPFLANLRVGNLAALSAQIDGVLAQSVYNPATGVFTSKTAALAANTSNGAEIGVFATTGVSGGTGLVGSTLTAGATGVHGHGPTGVRGTTTSGGVAVDGQATGSGSRAIAGRSDGNGSYGGYFSVGGVGGGATNIALYATATAPRTALWVDGLSLFTSQIQSVVSTGTAPLSVASTTVNTNFNADLLDGQHASAFQSALGFTPVRQGGGAGQGPNTVFIGWLGGALGLQVDATNYGATWPINVGGTAGGLSAAVWASPGAIGVTTPNSGRFSDLTVM